MAYTNAWLRRSANRTSLSVGGAGRVGAVRHDEQRAAFPIPLRDERHAVEHRVVDGSAASRLEAVERVADDGGRLRPLRQDVRGDG